MRRLLIAFVAGLVLATCCVPRALAQGTGDTQPTTVLLELGFSNELPSDQWAPVRVIVSPTDQAVQAVARIVVQMSSNDSITTIVPVDTTPGKETVTPTTLWVPPSIAGIQVDLVGQGGRRIASTSYGSIAGAQAIQLRPPTRMPIILGVGTPSLRLAFGNENYQRSFVGADEEALRNRLAVAKVAATTPQAVGGPPWLPTTPIAYQGLAATIVDGQLALGLEPAGVRALRESLISGGRVMVVNADNNALRALLGEHTPDGLNARAARTTTLPEDLGGPGEITSRWFDDASLPTGWKLVDGSNGLAAEGPVGLGWLMVLGFDPDELADAGLVTSTELAWHGTLAAMIDDELQRGLSVLGNDWDNQSLGTIASSSAMNWVMRSPAVGLGAFIAIFAMMVGLALAMGPINRLVLKRLRALHRWWLASLAWIALATIGAWILPPRVRSGPTSVNSVRVVDVWQSAQGGRHAWQSSMDGIFMNTSATIGLDDIDEGSWLSPTVDHSWQQRGGSGSLTMAPAGSVMKPGPTTARMWTVRTFQQHGATTPPIRAHMRLNGGRYTLRLEGDATDDFELAAVHTSGQWLHLLPGASPRMTGTTAEFVATRQDLTTLAPRYLNLDRVIENRWEYMYSDYGAREPHTGLALHLDGADTRGRAFDALGNTDQWAVVYLKWSDQTPLIGSDVGETFSTIWISRMAVPIEIQGAPR